jgi:hypothetical protein
MPPFLIINLRSAILLPMNLPLAGSWTATILQVRPFTIHGDIYYELVVDHDAGQATLRVPQHAVAGEPSAGQAVSIAFLLGQVTKVSRQSE